MLDDFLIFIYLRQAMKVYVNGLERNRVKEEIEENSPSEFLIVGIDIPEIEAIALRLPIRIGFNGEKYIWFDDIDPK